MSANNQAAAELFGLLSAFWQPPDQEFWNNLAAGAVDQELGYFSKQAGYDRSLSLTPSFRDTLPPLAAIQYFYLRCFVGIGKQAVLPIESVYKKWTTDPSARLPIAGESGYLMGDPALHVQYLINQYGLQIPPDYRMMPDHLVLLLELASILLDQRSPEETRLFLSQHLDWLKPFEQALGSVETENDQDRQAREFYRLALQRLQQAVDCQLELYSQ